MKNKHGNHPVAAHQHTSNPHSHVHPYLNHTNHSIPSNWFMEQHPHGYEYGKETRAPTKVRVGPDYESAPTKISIGPNEPKPQTIISVPPVRERVQHGDGITIKIDDEDDTDVEDDDMDADNEDDTDEDDEEEQFPAVYDVLLDISKTFNYLKDLRKQYRDLLPQLKEMKQDHMGCFLLVYSHVKTNIIEEQDGLEGTVFKKQRGKGVTESEGETAEETDNEDDIGNDTDTEDDSDTEEEETEENYDESDDNMDVKFDSIQEDESNKEPFFNFVFEAEHFLDAKSKETLEEYLARDKKNRKLDDGCDQDETDNPKNAQEVVEDIEEVISMWNEKEEDCFKQCSKRKIQSVCNMAHNWMDATSLNKMKKFNPSKYRFLKKMLSPHKNSLEKLVDANVSIHEKRKTLQKAQVGDGILQLASHLMIPLLTQALKR